MITLWVIYDKPKDHPNHFVVRKWFIKQKPEDEVPLAPFSSNTDPFLEPEWGGSYPVSKQGTLKTADPFIEVDRGAMLMPDLKAARSLIPEGLARMDVAGKEDPCIAEVWG